MTHRKFSGIISRIKVEHQLHIIFFITIFIPVLVLGNYLLYHSRTTLADHYREQAHSDNLRVKSIFLDLTSNVYNESRQLTDDRDLISLLSTDFGDIQEGAHAAQDYDAFEYALSEDASIQEISAYTYNTSIPDTEYIHPITDEIRQTSWYRRAEESATPFWTVESQTDRFNRTTPLLTLHCRIFLPQQNSFAILNVSVSNNHIKNRIENSSLKTVLWLNENTCFYQSGSRTITTLPEVYEPGASGYYLGSLEVNGQRVIGCISALSTSYSDDIFYIASIDYDAYPYMNRISLIHIALILLILIPTSIFVLVYSRHFSKRVVTLRESMHEASLGNYAITDSFSGNDEISEAFTDLGVMIQAIRTMEASAYEAELKTHELINQQQQMEFKMLSSQINPHFLYNTLETIRMRALKAGNREVANAIKLLGKSIRYVLSNTTTSMTSLEKELDYIVTYLAIQKLRFHDRVNYTLKTTPHLDLSQFQIMPLLLQPIVENAVLHGLEEVEENGKIIIHINLVQETLYIKVFDNGCGMTPEEIEKMKENIYNHPKESSRSIGLYNIYQRIRLCYGSDYGLEIKSKKKCGTLVTMMIPAQKYVLSESFK